MEALRSTVLISVVTCFSIFLNEYLMSSHLIDFYKKGPIIMKPDPDYAGIDYESIFYDYIKKISVTSDGTIFVSNTKQHNISKFKDGRLIKTFSQKGEGPSDLYYPKLFGILDDKYLIINQHSLIGKVSVFDLDGAFVKLIKTTHNVWKIAPLTNNKLAILISTSIEDRHYSKTKYSILIKDFVTGKEKYAWSLTVNSKYKSSEIKLKSAFYRNKVYLLKIGNGNFLVGYSGDPNLSVYSPEGEKIRSFTVKYMKKKITGEMKKEFRKVMEVHFQRSSFIKDVMKRVNWGEVFPEYTPYYCNIAVDSENNVLVFEHNGFENVRERKFQVYDMKEMYQCESKIDFGEFKSSIDLQLIFANGNIYSLLNRRDTDDILLQFIKIKIK